MDDSRYDFALRRSFDMRLDRVGREGEPVLTVEGVLADPQSLVDYAATEVTFAPAWGANGGYPGVRAPAPLNYVNKVVRALAPSINRAFGLSDAKLVRAECNLSMVVLPPTALHVQQRVPHFDTASPMQFAVLHYLCAPEHGGTAFYRHRSTGFEAITPDRLRSFEAARDAEIAAAPPPSAYVTRTSRDYEQIGAVEAAFDRLVIYRSRLLHSGQISQASALSDDPRIGRLTANIFVNFAPA
ncbi:hypothetical protein H8M03_07255 [Sphingomonas sabuli]|uniref:Uncharacterized protein n=1 Tax=Sphingomonas sabuli TaxID=2764186 RepID=A0A7G9KZQ7_9SPHN|nr:DUF6445 family protein [Sphingomonas sabuli]QNM81856.1 hypothetical protein H8M03_07255 [Sphingomonas sabuli]